MYGEILKKTRILKSLTQEDMAEELFCDTSVISKMENNYTELTASRMIEWLAFVNRIDIIILLLDGMDTDTVLKTAFTEEYLNILSQTDIPNITIDQIKERFNNSDETLAYFNKN